jgi:hypothetical protein
MFYLDQDTRRQLTTDRIERLTDDYTKATGYGVRRRTGNRTPLATTPTLAQRVRHWATALQPETKSVTDR